MPVSVARAPVSTRTSQPPPPAAQGDGCASVWARAEDKLCFGSFFCPEPEIWPMLAGHAAAPSLGPPARQSGSTAGGLAALKTRRERPPGARVGSSQPSHGIPRCPRPQGLCCPLRQGERGRGRDQRGALGWVRWGGERPGLLTFVADVFVALFPPPSSRSAISPSSPPASSCGTGAVLAGAPRGRGGSTALAASSSPAEPPGPLLRVPPGSVSLCWSFHRAGGLQFRASRGQPTQLRAGRQASSPAHPRAPAGPRFAVTHSQPTLILHSTAEPRPHRASPCCPLCVSGPRPSLHAVCSFVSWRGRGGRGRLETGTAVLGGGRSLVPWGRSSPFDRFPHPGFWQNSFPGGEEEEEAPPG